MLRERLDKAGEFLLRFLSRRRWAYRRVFDGPHARYVLEDLARFCRATQPTFHEDARQHALLEGRREVWLRIQQHLSLSDEELYVLTFGQPQAMREVQIREEDDE